MSKFGLIVKYLGIIITIFGSIRLGTPTTIAGVAILLLSKELKSKKLALSLANEA